MIRHINSYTEEVTGKEVDMQYNGDTDTPYGWIKHNNSYLHCERTHEGNTIEQSILSNYNSLTDVYVVTINNFIIDDLIHAGQLGNILNETTNPNDVLDKYNSYILFKEEL